MRSILKTIFSAFAACATLGAPATAQTFTGSESHYASVRGWDVIAISDANGVFTSCGAVKQQNGNRVFIGQGTDRTWVLSVPTRQTSTFGGGILDIDKVSIDSQFGFIGGFAYRQLSNRELKLIKAGSQLGIKINGDGPERWWSLHGSTAAVLKATECVQRGGHVAAAAPASPTAPIGVLPRPTKASRMLTPSVPVGQSQVGDCQMGFTNVYRCTFEGLPAKAGYLSSTRVMDVFGEAPTVDLDALSATQADVWAHINGQWNYMGRWIANHTSGECLVPELTQTAEARNNLGQDAWMLCLK